MKDARGLYYYPFPQNKQVRMYVKAEQDTIFFRLWKADDKTLWEEHGWVPHDAVKRAVAMFHPKNGFNPAEAYDVHIARALLKEDR